MTETPSRIEQGGGAAERAGEAESRAPTGLAERVGWNVAGHVVLGFSNWLMLMVLAKMSGADAVGHFAFGLAIAAPLFVFSNLGLRAAYISDVKGDFAFGHYFALRLVVLPATLLVVVAIVLALDRGPAASAVMMATTLLCATTGLSDIFYAVPHRAENMRQIGISRIIKGVLAVVVLPAVLALTGSVALGLAGVVIAWLVHIAVYDFRLASRSSAMRPLWNAERMFVLVRLMMPLGLAASLAALALQLPAFGVEHFHGAAALGFYSAVVAILAFVRVASLALAETALPRLARLHAARDRRGFWRSMAGLMAVTTAACLGLLAGVLVLGKPYLRLAFTPEFEAYYRELMVAAGTGMAVSWVVLFVQGVFAIRYFRSRLLVAVAGAAAGLAVVVLAVPALGVMGGVLALAASSGVGALVAVGILVAFAAR